MIAATACAAGTGAPAEGAEINAFAAAPGGPVYNFPVNAAGNEDLRRLVDEEMGQ